jgi:phage terminase large subunit
LNSSSSTALRVEVPRAFKPLLSPKRYKGAHGGRGSGKSHFFAEQLVLRSYGRTTRAACIREVQNSLKESVKQLLIDKIQKFGLGNSFEVLESEIRGPYGSLIIFRGMQAYNAETIKSLEGYDIAWVEEAQALSDVSLRMLRPTIRKDGSEIWFSWNPRYDSDAVDKFLRGGNKPADAAVVEVNWYDNPWFPEVLRKEKEQDYGADPEMAEHVWGGGYQIISEGSYYARLIAQAEKEGRIGDFPYNPALPLRTGWDLGIDDYTAIWFVQDDGKTATVVDYYEASGDHADEIIPVCMPELNPDQAAGRAALSILGRSIPFKYQRHHLPHDVKVREWGSGHRSRRETLMSLGVKPIIEGVATNPADRVQAVRKLLPITRFNNTPRVQIGLSRLRRYRRKWNETLGSFTTPEHDMSSHGADAFGEYAINCGLIPHKEPQTKKPNDGYTRAGQDRGASWRERSI